MTKKGMLNGIIIFSSLIICANVTNAQDPYMKCDFWQSKANPEIKIQSNGTETATDFKVLLKSDKESVLVKPFSDLDEKETFFGIECLLKLQGNKNNSDLSGATRPDVSITLKSTSIEVAALYYVSYVFFQKWDHADAPFLVSKAGEQNSRETVSKAYKAYKKWFKKIKKIGLEESRKQKIDPLGGSDIRWY